MAILNYTTECNAARTAGEIQAKLVKAKASAVMMEYANGEVVRISFKINTEHGEVAFQLPANVEGVFKAMQRDSSIPNRYKTREQAVKVAWRILKDWIEAQIAVIEAGMATLPQVFLPYAQTSSGQTVYERFTQHGLKALTYQETADGR